MPELRVLFVGCGDLGTGAAHLLWQNGLALAIVELAVPLAVRRGVAFASAARDGAVVVEGVRCERRALADLAAAVAERASVPLVIAPVDAVAAAFRPHAVVDARVAKRPLAIALPPATFRIALGPGHIAGRDCDVVIETLRGPDLGRVIWQGAAAANTHMPGEVGGATFDRVLRAPCSGIWRTTRVLGERIEAQATIGYVADETVRSRLAGRIRGLLPDGDVVAAGQKLGDVDPRADAPGADQISDKAHRVAVGVLTALRVRFGPEASPPP
jgi:xanthine dehydrogenase accessory factor